ncbi:MAG TPA: hypothetical protein VGR19_06985 [Allosphingosinicella sp.]|nr:hypothetical protein [Allosphingosinicella sp.]
MRLLLALLIALPTAAFAQAVTSSPAPDKVSVTIYRDPRRDASQGLDLEWLNGYALISEIRRISIPAGEGEIRFEGVAGGILPESAIVTGLPEGVIEKNQDAYLLSPASLLDRSLGRRVHVRRTSMASGKVVEHEAVIRSSPDGAVVLQTAEGFEALRCSGLPETIVYDKVPEGLSAKPTLSVRTRSSRPASATVTLSYLASGFDWQANYVATLAPQGDRLDLFAWVTLANGDETSFVDAETQTVAGRLNREERDREEPRGEPLNLQCWPAGSTSDIELEEAGLVPPPPPPLAYVPAPVEEMSSESIVVTGSRVRAIREELGDLKLYRIPERVTVASNSQKQVAMLEKEGVKVQTVYRASVGAQEPDRGLEVTQLLVTRNRASEGLGLPLPAGRIVLFAGGRPQPLLLGEGFVDDKAVGEDVEIRIARASGVGARVTKLAETGEWLLTVTNDQARPVLFEAEIYAGEERFRPAAKLARRNGKPLWIVTVPANGSATLRYSLG